MKLYYHPVSTTSRPIVLFAAESNVPLDYQVVDLFSGEQYKPEYSAVNPSHQVPVLEDGDFRLTESSASSSIWPRKHILPRIQRICASAQESTSGWIGSIPVFTGTFRTDSSTRRSFRS